MQSVDVRVRCSYLLPALALLVSLHAHAQEVGTLTLLNDTTLGVIRGYSVLKGVEGMRLRQGDILVTGPAASAQAQLEFTGGAIIELGPSTQLLVFSHSPSAAELVLLTGWLKGETTAGAYRYASPLITATSKGGNILLHAQADAAEVFVEKGTALISMAGLPPVASSADKLFFARKAGKPLPVAGRPSQEFVAAMPVSFRDFLPSRLSKFSGKKPPEPKSDHDVSYAEIERWLMISPQWRRGFVERFKPRLQDSAFRQAIDSHLMALPEWEPVLHPEHRKTGPSTAVQSNSPSR
jgi:hypothetical protein